MNTLSTWIASAAEDRAAPVVWLTVKFTVYLATLWLLHAMLRRLNPRWRVLLWRSSVAGFVVLAGFFYLPPLMSWSVPSTPASDDRTVRVTTTHDAVSLVVKQPSVDQSAKTELARDRTAPSGLSPPDGHGKSDNRPDHADASAYAVARDRPERGGAGLTWFDLTRRGFSYVKVAQAIWCGGVLLGTIWTAIGLRRLVRIRARATEVPPWVAAQLEQVARGLGLKSVCAIRATRDLNSPCLMGLWRPAILLPERQCGAESRAELASILAHELAHLRRGDLAWNALFHGLSILLWFHPLVWRVRIAHADACDAVADAIAADYVGDASHYARTLAVLTLRVASPDVTLGLSMARKSDTRQRIEAIQRHVFRAPLSRSRATIAVSVAALGTGLLGGLGFERSSAESAAGRLCPGAGRLLNHARARGTDQSRCA